MIEKKQICYREAIGSRSNSASTLPFSLQIMLEEALSEEPSKRKQTVKKGRNNVRLIFSHQKYKNCLCGRFVQFNEGAPQPILTIDESTHQYAIATIKPNGVPSINETDYVEFIRSILYFVVKDNHVVIVSAQNLSSKQLENHINWLLREHTHILDSDEFMVLAKRTPQSTEALFRMQGVKKVAIGINLGSQQLDLDFERGSDLKIRAAESIVDATINAIKNRFAEIFDSKSLEEQISRSNLRVGLSMFLEKSMTFSGAKFLEASAISFRNFDSEETQVFLSDGSILQGDKLDVRGEIEVDEDSSGLPILNHIWEAMLQWLSAKVDKEGIGSV